MCRDSIRLAFQLLRSINYQAGFNIYGDWKYSNGAVLAVPVDYQAKAETTRQKLLDGANSTIARLANGTGAGVKSVTTIRSP
nr:Caudovirales tail fiber assembly protein [Salmonella sp. NCTC 7297]